MITFILYTENLGCNGLAIDNMRTATPGSLRAKGMPALILVNSDGLVVDSWIGKLTIDKETEVLARLRVDQRNSN